MGIITDDVHSDEKHTSRVSLLFESMPAFIFHDAIGPSLKNVSPCRKKYEHQIHLYTEMLVLLWVCEFFQFCERFYVQQPLWKLQDRLNFEKWNGEMVAGH